MARPHIMFIQAQDLPWQTGLPSGSRADVESRILSIDADGTDCTLLVRYPEGWEAGPEYLLCLEEFVVIDGWIEINGVRYDRQTYGCLPGSYPRISASCPEGAVLLAMYHGKADVHSGAPRQAYDAALLVEHVDPLAMVWDAGLVDPQLAPGVAIKPLRTDPVTGETSFFYMSPPHRVPPGMAKPQWTHSMVEELYCLHGEYVWGDCGRMGPGGYAWWREGEYHGPSGTDTGYLLFVRTINGPLDNIFATEKKPFTWNPEFNPALPPELKAIARPYPRVTSY